MMPKIITHLKKNIFVYSCALLVGIISIMPHFVAVSSLGTGYHGIPFMPLDNEDFYLASIHEILDGHGVINSPIFFEYKNNPSLLPPVGAYVYSWGGVLLALPWSFFITFSKCIFPALIFLLVYAVTIRLLWERNSRDSRITAAAAGLLVTLGYDFVDVAYTTKVLMQKFSETHALLWTRPIAPSYGLVVVFLLLLVIHKMLTSDRWYWWVVAGVVFALSPGYYFSWGMCGAILSVFGGIALIRKRFSPAKRLLGALAIGILINAPYFFLSASVIFQKNNQSLAQRNGLFFTHAPVVNKFLVVGILAFILVSIFEKFGRRLYPENSESKNFSESWWFLVSLLAASVVVFNQQIITGRSIWVYHFVQFTIPMVFVVGVVIFYNYIQPLSKKVWAAGMVCIYTSTIFFGVSLARSAKFSLPAFAAIQAFAVPLDWLNAHAAPDCVVLSSLSLDTFNRLVPVMSHCNVYESPYVYFGIPPQDRIEHNYFVTLALQGATSKNVEQVIEADRLRIRSYFFSDWKQYFGATQLAEEQALMKKLASEYRDFLSAGLPNQLKKYRLDYIALDKPIEQSGVVFGLSLTPVLVTDKIFVYHVDS